MLPGFISVAGSENTVVFDIYGKFLEQNWNIFIGDAICG
jgi:hypothetical protein